MEKLLARWADDLGGVVTEEEATVEAGREGAETEEAATEKAAGREGAETAAHSAPARPAEGREGKASTAGLATEAEATTVGEGEAEMDSHLASKAEETEAG